MKYNMDSTSIILILLLFLTFLLLTIWCIQALNEDYNNIKFNNIYDFIDYHYENLLKSYQRIDNKQMIKKLELKLKENYINDLNKIASILDEITMCYSNIGNNLASRDVCLQALKLRRWYLPEKHKDVEMNLEKLMMIHSSLEDHKAARNIFEYKMDRVNYFRYLNNVKETITPENAKNSLKKLL